LLDQKNEKSRRSCRYLLRIFAPKRFILFAPENADFVGDLLRSFLQKSSISVRSQNPTIPRPKVILNWELGLINESLIVILLDKQATNRISATLFFLSIRQALPFLFD
jgi:hypothetical protein